MRTAAALIILAFCGSLGGCALGQDMYDERRLEECLELPTPDERMECQRRAHDDSIGLRPVEN